jgi:carbonic anhydrase
MKSCASSVSKSHRTKLLAENNVRHSMKLIREKSPILKEMEDKGEIKIVGAFYRLTDGTLEFVE